MVALPASAGGGTLLFYTGAWVSGDSALNCTGATESRLIAMPGFRYNVNLSFPKTGSWGSSKSNARCRERSATAGLSEARERTADWSRLPVRKPPAIEEWSSRTDALACNHNILFPELVLPDSTCRFWTLSRCRNGSGSEWVRSAAPILNVRAGKWCENPNHPKHRHFRNLQTGCRS